MNPTLEFRWRMVSVFDYAPAVKTPMGCLILQQKWVSSWVEPNVALDVEWRDIPIHQDPS